MKERGEKAYTSQGRIYYGGKVPSILSIEEDCFFVRERF